MQSGPVDPRASWERLVVAHQAVGSAAIDFMQADVDHAAIVSDALNRGGSQRMTALYVFRSLPLDDKLRIFPTLLYMAAGSQGTSEPARDLIVELPREWVLVNIETLAESILAGGSDEDYRGLLRLYQKLDTDLTRRLAQRAARDADPEVRLAGEDFLLHNDC